MLHGGILLLLANCSSKFIQVTTHPAGASVIVTGQTSSSANRGEHVGMTPNKLAERKYAAEALTQVRLAKKGYLPVNLVFLGSHWSWSGQETLLVNLKRDSQFSAVKTAAFLMQQIILIKELLDKKQYELALYEIAQSQQVNARLPIFSALAGSAFFLMKAYAKARTAWKEALDLQPNSPKVQLMLKELDRLGY